MRIQFYSTFLDGHFLLAVSSGDTLMPILCYTVSVKKTDDKCVIMSQSLPSFFLFGDNKESKCMCINLKNFIIVTPLRTYGYLKFRKFWLDICICKFKVT